jgi:hypothetical protein
VRSKHSGVMQSLSNIAVELVSYAFSSSANVVLRASKYFFGSLLKCSHLLF